MSEPHHRLRRLPRDRDYPFLTRLKGLRHAIGCAESQPPFRCKPKQLCLEFAFVDVPIVVGKYDRGGSSLAVDSRGEDCTKGQAAGAESNGANAITSPFRGAFLKAVSQTQGA